MEIRTNVTKLKTMMQIQAGDRFGQLEMKDRTLDFEYEMEFKKGMRL